MAISVAQLWLHEDVNGDIPSGWFVQAEPGTGGGKLSVGRCWFAADELNFSPPYLAVGLKGSALRTWGSPLHAARERTFIGPGLDVTLLFLKASVGWLWPVGSSGAQQERLTPWGVGIGF